MADPATPCHVAHLAPGHVPFDTRVFQKEARTLAASGYRVTVVAPHDRDEEVDGVRVIGIARWRSRAHRFLLGPMKLARLAFQLKADVYHVHDVEAWPAALALAVFGRTVIVDSHEDYPRLVLSRRWIPVMLRRPLWCLVRLVEMVLVRSVSAVISAEDEGARRFGPGRAVVVRNYALPSEFPDAGRPLPERSPVAVYVGDITVERGAREMVEAIGRVRPDLEPRLILGGRIGTPGLLEELEALPAWGRVEYRGVLSRDGVRQALAEAQVGLALLHSTPKSAGGTVPVKLFEYLVSGLPVVASDLPPIRAVLTDTGGGYLVDPLDVGAIAVAMESVFDDPAGATGRSAAARAAVLDRYTWRTEGATLLAEYGRLTGGPRAGRAPDRVA